MNAGFLKALGTAMTGIGQQQTQQRQAQAESNRQIVGLKLSVMQMQATKEAAAASRQQALDILQKTQEFQEGIQGRREAEGALDRASREEIARIGANSRQPESTADITDVAKEAERLSKDPTYVGQSKESLMLTAAQSMMNQGFDIDVPQQTMDQWVQLAPETERPKKPAAEAPPPPPAGGAGQADAVTGAAPPAPASPRISRSEQLKQPKLADRIASVVFGQ